MSDRRPKAHRRSEAGAVLVLVAMFLFAVFAIAALVLDLGSAVIGRTGLSAAADVAALEGMRARDGQSDPIAADAQRRALASSAVALLFDDDLEPDVDLDATTDTLNLGAGPVYELQGGSEVAQAHQLVGRGQPRVYKPRLEANLGNAVHGDLVAGRFDFADRRHLENEAYARTDFTVAPPAAAPFADAFLARLRRTPAELSTSNLDRIPGQSSSGAALPFLFGRAALTAEAPEGVEYDPRRHGLTLRGTAIAGARRVTFVGRPRPGLGLVGATTFALDRDAWEALVPDAVTTVDVALDGSITAAGNPVGRFVAPALSLGQAIAPPGAPLESGPFADAGYVVIFAVVGGADRVVGFGSASLAGDLPGTASLVRGSSRIAPANASAHLVRSLPSLDAGTWQDVLAIHATLTEPLLAATLVR